MPHASPADPFRVHLFPEDAVPTARRGALKSAAEARRPIVGRLISCAALFALCAGFSLFYGAFSAYAWSRGMSPAVGSLFSVLSGLTLVAAVRMAWLYAGHRRELPEISEALRREAKAEAALARAALEANVAALLWNRDAHRALADGAGDDAMRRLWLRREDIAYRNAGIEADIRRHKAAIAPKPVVRMMRVSSDWGPIEVIDIGS